MLIALLKAARELKRLVDSAPATDRGIRTDNRSAFRKTLHKIHLIGSIANLQNYKTDEYSDKGNGVSTEVMSTTYEGASLASVINAFSMTPFGVAFTDQRELDSTAVDLFQRRYAALEEAVSEAVCKGQLKGILASGEGDGCSQPDDLRPARWFDEVTNEILNPDTLRQAAKSRRLTLSCKPSGRWLHSASEVARLYPEHEESIRAAMKTSQTE